MTIKNLPSPVRALILTNCGILLTRCGQPKQDSCYFRVCLKRQTTQLLRQQRWRWCYRTFQHARTLRVCKSVVTTRAAIFLLNEVLEPRNEEA